MKKSRYIPSIQSPTIESYIKRIFGSDRGDIISNKECSFCKEPSLEFRDEIARKEYELCGICQTCQDEVYIKKRRKR